jgi:hypothetical protein
MRRRVRLRRSTLRRAALAAPVVAAPMLGAGLAQAADELSGGSGSGEAIKMTVTHRRIAYGHDVTVTGHAPSGDQGRWVALDFAPVGSASWHKIAARKIDPQDRFRLQGRTWHSGRVKVVGTWHPGGASTNSPPPASKPESVQVMAALHVDPRTIDDMGDHAITVSGKLQPVGRGLVIRLQARSGRGGWHKVAQDLTSRSGRFYLHYTPSSRQELLRVHFVGSRSNAPVRASAGQVVVFTQSVASWYYDAGSTACGYHATYGVANLSLPCGTQVTFVYHGRRVTATVDDRGPYVSGREWDLNQNTASALGFSGVDDVWASR